MRLINFFHRHGLKTGIRSLYWRAVTRLVVETRKLQGRGQAPDFLIIGVMKGGTTSLYNYLCQHPDILPGLKKEVHFFDIDKVYDRGLDWYKANFPDPVKGKITGEASPCYIFEPEALERIMWAFPNVKLIVLLRDPVDRAWSHYNMMVEKKYETLSPGVAFQNEELRLRHADEWERKLFSYIARGQYIEQLNRLHNLFPPHHILIIDSEDFFNNPVCYCSAVFSFLGLKDFDVDSSEVHTKGNYNPIPNVTKKYLEECFK